MPASIVAIAAAAGCSPGDFLYVQVLLGVIGNYGDINTWWRKQFPDPATAPARLTFQAGALPFGAKIELRGAGERLSQRALARRLRRDGHRFPNQHLHPIAVAIGLEPAIRRTQTQGR